MKATATCHSSWMIESWPRLFVALLVAGAMLLLAPAVPADDDAVERELLVYSIWTYQNLFDMQTSGYKEWKPYIGPSSGLTDQQDPRQDFWDLMSSDCGSSCAAGSSIARGSLETTAESMVNPENGFSAGDMVFFLGHNATIQPGRHHDIGLWRPYTTDDEGNPLDWYLESADYFDWGTEDEPYWYHAESPIEDASLEHPGFNAYAIFYGRNALTSALIGRDFTAGSWTSENEWDQPLADEYSHGLEDTEWIFAHGCRALPVANDDGSWPLYLGVDPWDKSWSDLHLVFGHYAGTAITTLPDLTGFSAELKAGTDLRTAYFGVHEKDWYDFYQECMDPVNNLDCGSPPPLGHAMPSALSRSPMECCFWMPIGPDGEEEALVCPYGGCGGDYLHEDSWTDPMPSIDWGDEWYYSTSWKQGHPLVLDVYVITSPEAKKLVGGDSIPRRGNDYLFREDRVPWLIFASYRDDRVRVELRNTARKLLGRDVDRARIIDNGDILSLETPKGVAWAARDTGAVSVHLRDYPIRPTRVRGPQDAVDRALAQIAEKKLLQLSPGETLDVISVQRTHYGGWARRKDGTVARVRYGDATRSQVTFASEYSVYFGRSYRGVPIIGPSVAVVLDASGRMVSFRKGWREIAGTGRHPITIASSREIESRRDHRFDRTHTFTRESCGYVEAPGNAYHQNSPGAGCRFFYVDPDATHELQGRVVDLVNVSADESPPLAGERL